MTQAVARGAAALTAVVLVGTFVGLLVISNAHSQTRLANQPLRSAVNGANQSFHWVQDALEKTIAIVRNEPDEMPQAAAVYLRATRETADL